MKKALASYWQEIGISQKVVEAFMKVERENYVPKESRDQAYLDEPLPIGFNQTISQPTTVMMMLDSLYLQKKDTVLEIGAGSGYSAAIMAQLVKHVYAVEIVPELVMQAQKNLHSVGNVTVIQGDGSQGYEDKAPYDKIVVTAASPKIPVPLESQCKEGGTIVIPVGDVFQQKMVVARKEKGTLKTHTIGTFRFVQLKGKYGFV